MSTHRNLEPLPGLPPELAELDAELSGILLDERPSFGPELREELARRWAAREPRRIPVWVRHAMAAGIAALLLAGLAVPPARASLVTGVQRILDTLRGTEPELEVTLAAPAPRPVAEFSPEPVADSPEDREGTAASSAAAPVDLPSFRPGASSVPTLVDRSSDRDLIRRHYPVDLQRAGVGGTVALLLWVGEDGAVDHVQMSHGSGVAELDRAALQAAPDLRFRPAMRNGIPVGMWVEFDLIFEASPELRRPAAPDALATPVIPAVEGWEPPRSWEEASAVPAPIRLESRELLRAAMGQPASEIEGRFGPLDGILSGDAPAGVDPLRWRESVTAALEGARVRDPENPAPYLALARIRRSQGLRSDARLLFEEGLRRATRGERSVSPRLVAELAYEAGRLARENWLGWRDLGDIPARDLAPGGCPGAPASPGAAATVETLVSWNYACPAALGEALRRGFVLREDGEPLRGEMLRSFVAAVEAYPAHVGANTELLLEMADGEDWYPLLEGARRFGWASQSHPNALLLEGLALHRLGRTEEASDRFAAALEALPAPAAAGFRGADLVAGDAGAGESDAIWPALDPILSTAVNERLVEHWARSAYALLRFGSLEADASRVWIRYGRPDAMRSFGAGSGLRLEMWDYGDGPDLTFYRPAASQNGALTPEGEAYAAELAEAVPHWYGTRARPLYALPAQVTQFRGSRDGSVEMKVRFDVPGEFRAEGHGDPLEVGVFLLGAAGTPVETLRWTLAPGETRVDVLAPAGPGVHQVVVELYDPRSGMAAGVRRPVEREAARVSGLLLTAPREGDRRSVGRGGVGLDPLPSAVVAGDGVGVFLEIYDTPTTAVYRISASLVPSGGGAPIPLEARPSGQEFFGGEWARRPLEPGITPEFLTLDLRGIGPGTYTLRVTMDFGDGVVVAREFPGVERRPDDAVPGPLEVPTAGL